MTTNPLNAISTEDLKAMRARAYKQLKEACVNADATGLARKDSRSIAEICDQFIRFDDELLARETQQIEGEQ